MERLVKAGGAEATGMVTKTPEGYVAALSLVGLGVALTEGPAMFPDLSMARSWIMKTAERYGFGQGDFHIREARSSI